MRGILLLLISVISLGLGAQNTLEVASFRSPQFDFNYEQTDSVNIEVVVQNKGPNVIFGTDRIHFDIKVTSSDTTLFYNVSEFPLTNIDVNNVQIFTLIRDYKLDYESNYQICVGISGTDQYPTNIIKDPQNCISFVVGIEEQKLKASRLYFNGNSIIFDLNQVLPGIRYRVLDLSGKVLTDGMLRNESQQSVDFNPPAKGLYFLQLQAQNGQQTTQKFIVK